MNKHLANLVQNKALAKKAKANLTTPGTPKGITLKHVMLLDTGDGAYTDESVKVKPHKTNPMKLALKCTDLNRLMDAVKRMGLKICGAPHKGSKHFIVFCWKGQFGDALLAQGCAGNAALGSGTAQALGAKVPKALPMKTVKAKVEK